MGKDITLNGLSNKPRDNKVIVDVPYDPKQLIQRQLVQGCSFHSTVGSGTFEESLYSHQR